MRTGSGKNYDPSKAVENEPDPDPEITLAQKIIDLRKEYEKQSIELNDWEAGFVKNVHSKLTYPTNTFSAKQRGTIFRIWKREIQNK